MAERENTQGSGNQIRLQQLPHVLCRQRYQQVLLQEDSEQTKQEGYNTDAAPIKIIEQYSTVFMSYKS